MLTVFVVPAGAPLKCHCKTDCNAAFRNSSGPFNTRASVTLPLPSSVASTVTVPCTPFIRADTG